MEIVTDLKNGPLSQLALWIARGVLILLVTLGIIMLYLAFTRNRFVRREEANADTLRERLIRAVSQPDMALAVANSADGRTVAGRLLKTGFENMELAPEALEQVLVSQESVENRHLDKGVLFLANVASNAAFIGLLGTVCGILDAFAHLGEGGGEGAAKVMAAIAEALIATAMGLAVAIPAVVFYNNLSHRIRKVLDEARELRHLILAISLDSVARRSVENPRSHVKQERVYGG